MKKILLLFLILSLSCEKAEEDKYPDMPFFEDIINKELTVIKTETQPYLFDCFKGYYFLFNNMSNKIFIYQKKETFSLIKTINNGRVHTINKDGIVYYVYENQNGVKAYAIPYPYDKIIEIEHLDLVDYFGVYEILESHKSEFNAKNIEKFSIEFDAFIDEKRKEYIKNTFSNKLKCIKKISLDSPFYFLEYFDGKIQVIKSLEYIENDGGLLRAANNINFRSSTEKFPYCDDTHKHFRDLNLEEENEICSLYENNNDIDIELKLVDSVTLDYYLDGSNHIAIGVGSNNLFYYELTYKNRIIKFKSSSPVELANSIDHKFLILTKGNTYSLN